MTARETNTGHDLGGARGFGAIDRSQETQFAHRWAESVFGMTLACGMLGRWNLDQSRFAREQMTPEHYLASSYYEHWLHGLEHLLLKHGLVSAAELRSGKSAGKSALSAVAAQQVAAMLGKGAPTLLPAEADQLFTPGDRVRVRNLAPTTHIRAPRYTWGRQGIVAAHHGAHIFPDQHAASGKKQPRHLYNVRFAAQQLWGESEPVENSAVYVDLFEPYLVAADVET